MYKKNTVYLSIQPTQEWPWQPQRKAFDEQAPEPTGSQIPASKQDRMLFKTISVIYDTFARRGFRRIHY